MTNMALQALMSHWWRKPGQLVTLCLGLALATALWSAVQAINSEARNSYAEAETVLTPDTFDLLKSRDGESIPLETFQSLRKSGWSVTPVIEQRTRIGNGFVTLFGIIFSATRWFQKISTWGPKMRQTL